MKLTTILLIVTIMQVSAATYAQKITVRQQNITVKELFKEIKKQTGYDVFYLPEMLNPEQVVRANFKETSVDDVMKVVLSGKALTYTIDEKTIVIKKNDEAPPSKTETPPIPNQVSGKVIDTHLHALPGASIIVKRTRAVTLTDADGQFKIDNVQTSDTLVVSYIGYERQIIPVGNQAKLVIVMKDATNALDQVVVQAYGETSQRLTTSDIGKVTAADIEKQPVMNVLEALQGKVAGLDVTQTSGYASAPFKVEIRGRASINSSFTSDPLYIVDGVPLTVLDITGNDPNRYQNGSPGFIQNGDAGPAGGQSPFFSLNPKDIQSIEVLKDADATAIYGSRGANGVILITTKKGTPGKISFDAQVNEGVTHVTRFWQTLNTQQYLAMRKEAFRNDGTAPDPIADVDINGTWDTTRYTDWQRKVYGGWGKALEVGGGISGGDAQTTFRVGFGYNRTAGMTAVSGSDQQGTLSFNLGTKSVDNKFSLSIGANYAYTRSDMISIPNVIALAPDAPAIFDADGKLNFAGWAGPNNSPVGSNAYPFGVFDQPYVATGNFITSHMNIGYQFSKALNLSVNFGYNDSQNDETRQRPIASQGPNGDLTGSSFWGYNSNKNWIIEPLLSYKTTISKGIFNLTLGASEQQTNTSGLSITGTGYTSDDLLQSLSSAPTILTNQNIGEYRYNAIFGRLSYNWENKYLINLNGRRDGSSRFGPGKQFGNFGSVGAAWIFTEESWIKGKIPFLSFGKLRGSYGTTGSDAVGDYQFLSQYSSSGIYPYGGVSPLRPVIEANPNFHWQVNTKLEAAIELGFFKDRINIQVAYYRDRTGNQLIPFPLPAIAGFQSVVANSPALVQNTGLEYTAAFKLVDGSKFKWSANFNMAVNRNKLVAYPDLAQSPYFATYVVGQPLNIFRVLHYTGIDPLTGHYTFEDKNHDGAITYFGNRLGDDAYPIDLSPKFFGGAGMNFSYGDLSLSLFFNFKKQVGRNGLILSGAVPGLFNYNQPVDVLAHWQQPGDAGPYAKFTQIFSQSYSFLNKSDAGFTDASYVRLSNLELHYNLPARLVKKLSVQKIGVFVRANNLLTITGYKGIDPETTVFGGMPPTRTVVGGLSFNF